MFEPLKFLVYVKISRENFTGARNNHYLCAEIKCNLTKTYKTDVITLNIKHYVTPIDYKEFSFV